jgi:hypothetical protein
MVSIGEANFLLLSLNFQLHVQLAIDCKARSSGAMTRSALEFDTQADDPL